LLTFIDTVNDMFLHVHRNKLKVYMIICRNILVCCGHTLVKEFTPKRKLSNDLFTLKPS